MGCHRPTSETPRLGSRPLGKASRDLCAGGGSRLQCVKTTIPVKHNMGCNKTR